MIGLIACVAVLQSSAQQIAPEAARFGVDQPQLAVGRDDQVAIAYAARNVIYVSVTENGGRRFAPPSSFSAGGRVSLGSRRGPRIAITRSAMVVSAIVDGDLVTWRSTDGGETWIGPKPISKIKQSAKEGLHAMAARTDGRVMVAWLDLRSGHTQIYMSLSKDSGRSWSKDRLLYASPDGSVCECCHPSVSFGAFGEAVVMFRNSLRGSRDMFLARSTNGGDSFDSIEKIGNGTWEIAACPMDGGGIAIDDHGNAVSIWRRQDKLFLGKGTHEAEYAIGINPWIAPSGRNHAIVWQPPTGSGAYLQLGTDLATRRLLSSAASDPVVASTSTHAVCAWKGDGIYVEFVPLTNR